MKQYTYQYDFISKTNAVSLACEDWLCLSSSLLRRTALTLNRLSQLLHESLTYVRANQ